MTQVVGVSEMIESNENGMINALLKIYLTKIIFLNYLRLKGLSKRAGKILLDPVSV